LEEAAAFLILFQSLEGKLINKNNNKYDDTHNKEK
jgi:hypothetical protein